jgi:hypothetical protein
MTDPREYLLDRFTTDAATLRDRAAAWRPASPPPAGPDAATSARMADACDEVATLVRNTPPADDLPALLAGLAALVPTLEAHAARHAGTPPVRAVYAGAATRIRELLVAEQRAAMRPPA